MTTGGRTRADGRGRPPAPSRESASAPGRRRWRCRRAARRASRPRRCAGSASPPSIPRVSGQASVGSAPVPAVPGRLVVNRIGRSSWPDERQGAGRPRGVAPLLIPPRPAPGGSGRRAWHRARRGCPPTLARIRPDCVGADEIGDARRDLGAEARAVEHAVVADAGLQCNAPCARPECWSTARAPPRSGRRRKCRRARPRR